MRLLGIRIGAFLPGEITGANRSLDMILRQVGSRGHDVALLCAADRGAGGDGWHRWTAPYRIHRMVDPLAALPAMLAALQPNVVLVYGSRVTPAIATLCSRERIRCVHFASSASFEMIENVFTALPGVIHVAASRYTARKFSFWYGLPVAIVPPMIDGPPQALLTPGGDRIVFVNPIAEKGVHLVFRLATLLPHRRFTIFESWTLDPAWLRHIRSLAPANIEWRPPSIDAAAVYRDARLLLMPSVWEESWGRVASEAQAAGVPVIASDLGGLPESVGSGGKNIALAAPLTDWIDSIEALFDAAEHAAASAAALAHAARSGFDVVTLTDKWLSLLDPSAGEVNDGGSRSAR